MLFHHTQFVLIYKRKFGKMTLWTSGEALPLLWKHFVSQWRPFQNGVLIRKSSIKLGTALVVILVGNEEQYTYVSKQRNLRSTAHGRELPPTYRAQSLCQRPRVTKSPGITWSSRARRELESWRWSLVLEILIVQTWKPISNLYIKPEMVSHMISERGRQRKWGPWSLDAQPTGVTEWFQWHPSALESPCIKGWMTVLENIWGLL